MVIKRILICGGRDFTNWHIFSQAMEDIVNLYLPIQVTLDGIKLQNDMTIMSGGASGADEMAREWAKIFNCAFIEYPADWHHHGKRAGYIRNKQMLEEGSPELVIAFPGGKGTAMMIDLAQKAKILTLKVSFKDGIYQIDELNKKAIELKTDKFRRMFIDRVQEYKMLTPGQKAGIYREFIEAEEIWLANMGKDYDEMIQAQDIMDKLNDKG